MTKHFCSHIHGCWLITGVFLFSNVGAQDAQLDPNAVILRRQFFEAYEHNEVEKGIELGLKADEAKPGDPLIHFNLARLYARSGNKERATHWFDMATRNGFVDIRAAAIDPDLEHIRDEPAYKQTIARLHQVLELVEIEPQLIKLEPKDPLIVLPPGLDSQKPAPLLVLLHGIAEGAEGISSTWKDAAAERGAIIVAPHAGFKYPEGVPDWGPAQEAEKVVLQGIEFAKSKYKVDSQRVVIAGFSPGGKLALIIGMRNAELIKGVITYAAQYDPWLAKPPTNLSKSSLPRIFLGVGDIDGMRPGNEQADIDFRHAGLPTKLVVYPNTGHEYPKELSVELPKALEWVWGAKP